MAAPLLDPINEMLMGPIIGIADVIDESLRNFGVIGEWVPNMIAQPLLSITDALEPLSRLPFLDLITRPVWLFSDNLGMVLTR